MLRNAPAGQRGTSAGIVPLQPLGLSNWIEGDNDEALDRKVGSGELFSRFAIDIMAKLKQDCRKWPRLVWHVEIRRYLETGYTLKQNLLDVITTAVNGTSDLSVQRTGVSRQLTDAVVDQGIDLRLAGLR